MKYEEAMAYIKEVGNFGSNYGLERTLRILEILGDPQKAIKFIHVAGTNGKGSVTSMITSMLIEYNFKVGMYTSPFLEEFEERIQINRVNIPKNILGDLIEKVKISVDKVIEEGYTHPTEFEIITCLMLLYFKEEKVDYGVIEVGLGGRLDSTNVINPILSIITSISFDHTNLLGNTLAKIAAEKAGIIKENIPVIIYPQEEDALCVIKEVSSRNNSELLIVDKAKGKFDSVIEEDRYYQRVLVMLDEEEYNFELPLLGEHQITNLLVALSAFNKICKIDKLKFDISKVKSSIKKVKWIGRLETMNKNPLIVIDGAHNIQGIKALRKNVLKYFKFKDIYLLLGILADKQVSDMVEEIAPIAKKIYALTPHSERAELAEDLKKEIEKVNPNCSAFESYEEAINLALKEAGPDDLILISGSLYMIGDMRKILNMAK